MLSIGYWSDPLAEAKPKEVEIMYAVRTHTQRGRCANVEWCVLIK